MTFTTVETGRTVKRIARWFADVRRVDEQPEVGYVAYGFTRRRAERNARRFAQECQPA